MKTNTILWVYLLLLIVCYACAEQKISDNKIVITGKVKNFENFPDHGIVEFFFNDPLTQQIGKIVYLDEEGKFRLEYERIYPQDFYIKYHRLYKLYISPGDSLYVEIDANVLNTEIRMGSVEHFDYITVSGSAAEMNNDLIAFNRIYTDSLWDWYAENEAVTKLNPGEYKLHISKRMENYMDFLEKFNKKNNTCRQFSDWASITIKYKALDDLMRYRWLHPMQNKMDRKSFRLPDNYYDFLSDMDMEDEKSMISTDYYRFLSEYFLYLQNFSFPEDSIIILDKFYKEKDLPGAYSMVERQIINNSSGFVQKVLLSRLYYQFLNWKEVDLFEHLYKPGLIAREDFNNILQTKYNELKRHIENPLYADYTNIYESSVITDSNILNQIIRKNKNKVVYIDFWAPWCGPCMDEMPDSKKLQEEYKDKEVAFVFLANNCEEKAWKATISEKQLSGEHYLLTYTQYAILSNMFEFTGIPHYVLINRKGEIVDPDAPRPGEKENLNNLINRLLDES